MVPLPTARRRASGNPPGAEKFLRLQAPENGRNDKDQLATRLDGLDGLMSAQGSSHGSTQEKNLDGSSRQAPDSLEAGGLCGHQVHPLRPEQARTPRLR